MTKTNWEKFQTDELERIKLSKEIDNLSESFWKKNFSSLVGLIIGVISVGGSIFLGFYTGLFDIKRENLEIQKEGLRIDIVNFEQKKREIKDSIKILSVELLEQNNEISKLKGLAVELETQRDKFETQVRQIPDTIAKKLIVKYLEDIDSQSEFYYNKNPKSFSKFGKVINSASPKIFKQLIDSYINDEKKLWQNRMYVIMASYYYSSSKDYFLKSFQQNLNSEICSKLRNSEFSKILTCKEWDDNAYHKNLVYIIKKSNDQSCPNSSTFKIINNWRIDTNLSANNDLESFLLFLNIYKSIVLKKESEIKLINLASIVDTDYISSSTRKACLSKYILENEEAFDRFVEKSKTETDKGNLFSTKRMIKNICTDLNITETDFYSTNFWKITNEKNKELLNRILEDGFVKYKKDVKILIDDTK